MVCNNDDESDEIGGSVPCGPAPCTPAAACSSSLSCTCGCNPCSCGLSLAPFYNEVPGCQETHVKVCTNQTYTAAVTAGVAFNMPACGQSITVPFPGLKKLQVGSFLWNTTFGYLQVTSFDCVNETVTLYNDCQPDNAAPGTRIPSCTLFNVVDPPADPYDNCGEGVWLTVDYNTPVLNGSVTISVSSTEGLLLNRNVQVGHGVYLLTAIVTANSITIKNIGGAGVVPFQIIHALDAQGRCITPITAYSTDACAETPTTPGALVVCVNGAMTTLNATALGQMPVCVDVAENLFEPQTFDIPQVTCTFLTACLTLISGIRTYTIIVDNTADFAEGDVITIETAVTDDVLWVITHIASGTQMTIYSIEAQTLDTDCLDVGIAVCHAPCCEQVKYDLDQLAADLADICAQDWSAAQKGQVQSNCPAAETGATMNAGASFVGGTYTINFSNDTCDTMRVMVGIDYYCDGHINSNEGSWARINLVPHMGYSTAVLPAAPGAPVMNALKTINEDITIGTGPSSCSDYNTKFAKQWHETIVLAVAPNTALRIDAMQELAFVNYVRGADACGTYGACAQGSGLLTIDESTVCLHGLGIALKEA